MDIHKVIAWHLRRAELMQNAYGEEVNAQFHLDCAKAILDSMSPKALQRPNSMLF